MGGWEDRLMGGSRIDEIFADVAAEVVRAENLHPYWPGDLIHGAAIVAEEAGELIRATLQYTYENTSRNGEIREEALHTAATAIRLLINLERGE